MKATQHPDSLTNNKGAQNEIDERLQYLLDDIATMVPIQAGCIFSQARDSNHLTKVAEFCSEALPSPVFDTACSWLREHIDLRISDHTAFEPVCLELENKAPLHSALIWPLAVQNSVTGMIVLFSTVPGCFEDLEPAGLDLVVSLVRTVLEHRHFGDRLATTRAIAATAQGIARDPSPQNIINLLRENLFTPRVSNCWIALFGPAYDDSPAAPYEYVELQGSWSRKLGNRFGVGTRQPFEYYAHTLPILYERKLLTFTNVQNYISDESLDPISRLMIAEDQVESLTLLLLESETRRLGVLGIATDEPYPLTPHELRSYQIVAEFLTMSTMASALQRQASSEQQGRAALLDAVNDGVIMVLPDGKSSVLTINDQFAQMFGVSARNVQGKPLSALLDEMRVPASVRRTLRKRWIALHSESQERLMGEFRMSSAQQPVMEIEWYSAPVYQKGTVLGRIYTFHDITPERTSERLRSELLSRISHELRTPLTSIRGFAEFILETSGDELPPLAREYTQIIHTSAQHLNRLFTDMIDLTRANAGELRLQKISARLQDVIIEVVARMEPQYSHRHQRVVMDLDDELPVISMDVDRISQVIANMLGNAIKYSPEYEEIRIIAHRCSSAEQLPKGAPPETITPCLVVTVIDRGPGFSTVESDQLFLPFYRTEAAHSNKIEGAGLGLSIAHSIVRLHHGHIWAVPALRRQSGSQFVFTVPQQEQ